ncbi:hypothetical protein D0Z07_8576 [Hyphodiscus hymeniophilus]|uniref:BRCT domain-containing protein n=1 Tax=Hyphodiscus hymeniophilus TaxID=353542 RepID=A0A9P6VDU9_9HELO|nr:hypothetical protein D0Z07_8576 [Hyphodiscus hymeniophilus]
MNDQSPPKRVTRARAAAKTDTGVKIATAASKAKVTRATSIKHQGQANNENEAHDIQGNVPPAPKTTRGRPKKAADVHEDKHEPRDEMMEPLKTTRGKAKKIDEGQDELSTETIEPEISKTTRSRAKKATTTQPESGPEKQEEPVPAKPARGRPKKVVEIPAPVPARSTRGRATKVEMVEEDVIVVEEEPKKTSRVRAATISKATAPKKTVKFEEPDKENIEPSITVHGKAKATEIGTGLRAKPVRKPAAVAPRATRGRPKVEQREQKSAPLSPKKPTQVGVTKEQASDDELGQNEKTPMKPLMMSPVRAPSSVLGTTKRLDFSNSITVNRAIGQDLSASIMASPARRPPQSPFKESLKTSPQRASFMGSLMKSPIKLSLPPSNANEPTSNTEFKTSTLQSPARRPQSPTKVSEHGSPIRSRNPNPMISGMTPRPSTFKISRFATPKTLTKTAARPGRMLPPSAVKNIATENRQDEISGSNDLSAPSLNFSGRLSSIMPREVDSALSTSEIIVEMTEANSTIVVEQPCEPMVVDDQHGNEESMDASTTTPPCSPPRNSTGAFALREVDENPFMDSDSEDELASVSPKYSPSHFVATPATHTPFVPLNKTPKSQKSSFKDRRSEIGFTPLAKQLTDWMAASPEKPDQDDSASDPTTPRAAPSTDIANIVQLSPAKSSFFDDEMSVRDEIQSAPAIADDVIDEQNFTPVEVVEEDLALADEAEEMSLLEPDEIESRAEIEEALELLITTPGCIPTAPELSSQIPVTTDQDHLDDMEFEQTQIHIPDEPALSEASQEYGDENAMPIDPVLLAMPVTRGPSTPTYKTPKRVLAERVCHTVSKVPLKPAAEDSPMGRTPMKRSASISRIPPARPTSNLVRSNTVISYSPTKSSGKIPSQSGEEDVTMKETYATPSKSEAAAWSNMGAPARTPRSDLNTALLKGAVVFVDVHTSEGADASSLFTELLTQMGARYVKSWNWNPSSDDGSKIGITHIVFKDGGKRTLEKARETGGVVSCVGVGWVLDCERENKWLPEAPYFVDTAMIPRGGHRRRKSMEPKALANLTGNPFPSNSTTPVRKSMSPMKNPNSFADTPLTSKSRRRESVQWVRTPSSTSSGDDGKLDDVTLMLSPVPATPAPEFISAYGEDGLYGDETPYLPKNEQLVQQTAPVIKFGNPEKPLSKGFLSEKKDESVMMRLMAARRKSLQWAPKVGSPLARGGSPFDRAVERNQIA